MFFFQNKIYCSYLEQKQSFHRYPNNFSQTIYLINLVQFHIDGKRKIEFKVCG